jgi:hypothetical protein
MILPVRPHFIFDQVKGDRSLVVNIPDRQPGSPTLLEKYILLAVGKIVQAKRIFEIGTFSGATTEALANNFETAEVFTLDLEPGRAEERLSEYPNVRQLWGHSMAYDFTPYRESFGLVFVDGGHDYATVGADTNTAFQLILPPTNQAAIVWHDYGHPQFPGVAQCLQARPEPIYRVEETQLAIYFRN